MGERICPTCRLTTTAEVCPVDGFWTVEAQRFGVETADPLLGRVFHERYRIDEQVGQGGMGTVYRAQQLAVNRAVALKVLRTDALTNLKDVARFQQEARAVASLRHPNTVHLIDYGESEDGIFFLVMDLVEGRSLKELIHAEAPLKAERAMHILAQVAESLVEAHSLGIIHRDLKPANILLSQLVGRPDFVKVVDFGIAKVTGAAAADTVLTASGLTMGSPRYMAPEQASAMAITAQTDIYSMGTILYEMLTGHPLFTYEQPTEILIAHLKEEPLWPQVGGRRLKGPAVDLCMACLKKLPSQRPEDAMAVLHALQAGLEGALPARAVTEEPAPMGDLASAPTLDVHAVTKEPAPMGDLASAPTLDVHAVVAEPEASGAAGAAHSESTLRLQPPRVEPLFEAAVDDDAMIPATEILPAVLEGQRLQPSLLPGQHVAVAFSQTLVGTESASSLGPEEQVTLFEGDQARAAPAPLQTGHPSASRPLVHLGGGPLPWKRWLPFAGLLLLLSAGALTYDYGDDGAIPREIAGEAPALPLPAPAASASVPSSGLDELAPLAGEALKSDQVLLESDPSGAQVLIDGLRRGTTPLRLGITGLKGTLVLEHPEGMRGTLDSSELRGGGTRNVILRSRD